jgi:hypothetical protein
MYKLIVNYCNHYGLDARYVRLVFGGRLAGLNHTPKDLVSISPTFLNIFAEKFSEKLAF